jgi:DNA primase
VDLILEEGMNVRVCTFPAGEDPDSFARRNSGDALAAYLVGKAQDFIQFKTALLTKEAANDPIRKAETIRDIVGSIARIPDRIKREIYIQECASLLGISEGVLFNTLAQIGKKQAMDQRRAPGPATMEVVPSMPEDSRVDLQYELERKIIELLLLYGTETQEFEDLVLKENEKGELTLEPEVAEARVFEKVYLALQEDEIELTHGHFRKIYYALMEKLNADGEFQVQDLMSDPDQELVSEITAILMEEEKYQLHEWQRKDIYPKPKKNSVAQLVSETILSLRCYLIKKRIESLQQKTEGEVLGDHTEILEEILNYLQLNKLLSTKLNRVLS